MKIRNHKKTSELFETWRHDINKFAVESMGFHGTWQQVDLWNLIVASKFVSAKSGHGTGKSTAIAVVIIWFLQIFKNAQVVCTAPTKDQLRDVVWARISQCMHNLLPSLRDRFELQATRLTNKFNAVSFAVAKTARPEKPDTMQGFHAKNLLVIGDEAPGIADPIFFPMIGALTEANNKLVLVGNPTRNSGFFAETFKDSSWKNLTMNSEDSPLVQDEQVEFWKKKYGSDSDEYRIRVLGEFPEQDHDALFGIDMLEDAVDSIIPPDDPVVWGIDVGGRGGEGDKSILAKRYGNVITDVIVIPQGNPSEVANWIAGEHMKLIDKDVPVMIFVDVIGIGAGVYSRLLEIGLPVREVIANQQSSDPKRFHNFRAEFYCRLKDLLDSRLLKLPPDSDLKKELLSIEYFFDNKGAYQLVPKRKMVKSPDRADAVAFTCCDNLFFDQSHYSVNDYTYQEEFTH